MDKPLSYSIADGAGFLREVSRVEASDWIEARMWRRAYLCRYMHQPLSELVNLPSWELQAYVRAVKEMLDAMSPMAALAEMSG